MGRARSGEASLRRKFAGRGLEGACALLSQRGRAQLQPLHALKLCQSYLRDKSVKLNTCSTDSQGEREGTRAFLFQLQLNLKLVLGLVCCQHLLYEHQKRFA